jgi:membrane associated rhomboid family serine protease
LNSRSPRGTQWEEQAPSPVPPGASPGVPRKVTEKEVEAVDSTALPLHSPPVPKTRGRSFMDAVELSATIVLLLFLVFYLNRFLGGRLNTFGIAPRTGWGLLGILFSPLLHYDQAHLTANGVSLFVLLVILFSHREYRGDLAFLSIWLVSGIGTWVIGRPSIHIGASGLIYGVVTYLVASALWLRSWRSAIMAVLILFLYGGIFYGMLPQPGFISWEAHLSGAIAGVIVARAQHS